MLLINGLHDAQAVAALERRLGSPFDVTGAAHAGKGRTVARDDGSGWKGSADSVAYRAEQVAATSWRVTEISRLKPILPDRWLEMGARREGPFTVAGDVWRISLKPSDGPWRVRA